VPGLRLRVSNEGLDVSAEQILWIARVSQIDTKRSPTAHSFICKWAKLHSASPKHSPMNRDDRRFLLTRVDKKIRLWFLSRSDMLVI